MSNKRLSRLQWVGWGRLMFTHQKDCVELVLCFLANNPSHSLVLTFLQEQTPAGLFLSRMRGSGSLNRIHR